jgi:hypothetical protein
MFIQKALDSKFRDPHGSICFSHPGAFFMNKPTIRSGSHNQFATHSKKYFPGERILRAEKIINLSCGLQSSVETLCNKLNH